MFKTRRQGQETTSEKTKKSGNAGITKRQAKRGRAKDFSNNRIDIGENAATSGRKKIASGRITVPIDFFSGVAKSNKEAFTLNEQTGGFLDKDSHALPKAPRRSRRISTKTANILRCYDSAADYYAKCQIEYPAPATQQTTAKAKDKSLFKEINRCYRATVAEQKYPTQDPIEGSSSWQTKINVGAKCEPFCKQLQEQLTSVSSRNSRKLKCIGKIKTLITEIDDNLDGKKIALSPITEMNNATKTLPKEIASVPTRQLISKSKWSYETPGKQKLKNPIVARSCSTKMKPCLLQENTRSKVLFQLQPIIRNLEESKNISGCSSTNNADKLFSRLPTHNLTEAFALNFAVANSGRYRNVASLFHDDAVNVFEDCPETEQIATPAFFRPPINTGRRTTSFFGEKVEPFSCHASSEIGMDALPQNKQHCKNRADLRSEPNFVPFRHQLERSSLQLHCRKLPETNPPKGAAHVDILPHCSRRCKESKENCRPWDFSNRPERFELQQKSTFAMDEELLLPTFPTLSESPPLKFYPRKL